MKTTITTKTAVTVGLTMVLGLLAVPTMTLNAADSGTVKGATVLMRLNAPNLATADFTPAVKPMSCTRCTDTVVTVRDTDTRGAGAKTLIAGGAPTRTVAQHGCAACGNEWVIKGHGKAKEAVAIHKCGSCG
jgi:hypothetical protein